MAATIAIVASIETLLCLEAGDKMDPMKRYSSANTELKAQGIGNILSGLLGGLANDISNCKNNSQYKCRCKNKTFSNCSWCISVARSYC